MTINSALGFDSYMVMRHGKKSHPKKSRLRCYFCNDVVAPNDVNDTFIRHIFGCKTTIHGTPYYRFKISIILILWLLVSD
jgi:hypothetical protein